jgi:heat shock protein HslJ
MASRIEMHRSPIVAAGSARGARQENIMQGHGNAASGRRAVPVMLAPLLLLIGACAATGPAAGPPPELSGTSWTVTGIDGSSTGRGPDLTADFTVDGRVNGDSGCNSYSGPYIQSGDTVRIGELLSTRRACIDQARQQQEARLLRALQGASTIERERDGRIRLDGPSGSVMLAPLSLSSQAPGMRGRAMYDCGGVALTVVYEENDATLTWSGGHDELQRRPSDDGYWYESPRNTLRGSGRSVTWIQDDRTSRSCQELR